jgi:hypothetical protein
MAGGRTPPGRTPMLTGLRVQNFKSWKDSGDIRLAPG